MCRAEVRYIHPSIIFRDFFDGNLFAFCGGVGGVGGVACSEVKVAQISELHGRWSHKLTGNYR